MILSIDYHCYFTAIYCNISKKIRRPAFPGSPLYTKNLKSPFSKNTFRNPNGILTFPHPELPFPENSRIPSLAVAQQTSVEEISNIPKHRPAASKPKKKNESVESSSAANSRNARRATSRQTKARRNLSFQIGAGHAKIVWEDTRAHESVITRDYLRAVYSAVDGIVSAGPHCARARSPKIPAGPEPSSPSPLFSFF